MMCRICNAVSQHDLCNVCRQDTNYLVKYPVLKNILTDSALEVLDFNPSRSDFQRVDVICGECKSTNNIDLVSILKYIRRHLKKNPYNIYKCHSCSKRGESLISLKEVMPIIDMKLTQEKHGGIGKNVKKSLVVVKCEDCYELSDIKLSSLLHGARRHQKLGRKCIYKCFKCGVLLPDAIKKSNDARAKQLAVGARSHIEVALANRLKALNIEYEE